jgi:quinol monooxygenase YgiN
MSVVVIVTAFPAPEHRDKVIAAFETAITQVHSEPGVERYALHEGPDRLVMIEKYESEQARSEFDGGAVSRSERASVCRRC